MQFCKDTKQLHGVEPLVAQILERISQNFMESEGSSLCPKERNEFPRTLSSDF
jgi:hypothetical protein